MTHRLRLHRTISSMRGGSAVLFCMLNPSKARCACPQCAPDFALGSRDENDSTVRKCIGFATRWQHARMAVVNAYAMVSTDPKGLRRVERGYAIGDGNDAAIADEAQRADVVVAAWGVHIDRQREAEVLKLLKASGPVYRLGDATLGGHPRHPLYVPYETELVLHGD